MGMRLDCSCDECGSSLEDGEAVYCEDCFNGRFSESDIEEQVEERTAELKFEVKRLEDENNKLYEENVELKAKIEEFQKTHPLDKALGIL